MSAGEASLDALNEAKLVLAKKYNMDVWFSLEKTERDAEHLQRLIHSAHASYRLFMDVGSALQQQRGLYTLSRAYAESDDGRLALHYARLSFEAGETLKSEMKDFDRAYVLEALSRAYAVSGDLEQAQSYHLRAMAEGMNIQRLEDREIFERDLAGGNWGGLVLEN